MSAASAIAVVVSGFRQAARSALDAVLPARCLSCGDPVTEQGGLCPVCWSRVTFLGPPACACCGLPFAFDPGDALLCAGCLSRPPAFDHARAALAYDGGSRDLVLGFKHADRTHAAAAFGRWLRRAGAEMLPGAELIVPVPLHRWRLFRRRYNQAALLALALGKASGIPVAPDLLVRRRATPSQGGLGRTGRARNVRGAFTARQKRIGQVQDRHVLLVDDVMTTGATVSECARVLRRAGAAGVDVLTLARVIRPLG